MCTSTRLEAWCLFQHNYYKPKYIELWWKGIEWATLKSAHGRCQWGPVSPMHYFAGHPWNFSSLDIRPIWCRLRTTVWTQYICPCARRFNRDCYITTIFDHILPLSTIDTNGDHFNCIPYKHHKYVYWLRGGCTIFLTTKTWIIYLKYLWINFYNIHGDACKGYLSCTT